MAQKHKGGLGRGIGALIPSTNVSRETSSRPVDVFFQTEQADDVGQSLESVPGLSLASVPVSAIHPNAQQPRQVFDADDMAELVHSIREFGVLQPIVVRPIAGEPPTYELIMGERRWRASQEAGLDVIPAIVKETPDDEMLRDALLENLHRSELNPLEEASAYQQLLNDFGITQDELAQRLGRSRPQVSNMLRLLRLPESVQVKVASGVLSAGHARAILSASDTSAMERLSTKIINEGLSVREAERLAKADGPVTRKHTRPRAGAYREQLDELAERLEDQLETPVRITLTKRKGSLTIDFGSIGDLNRIVAKLGVEGFPGK